MQKTLKKSISILLSILMIVGVFTIVPITASAAVQEQSESFITKGYSHYDDWWESDIADPINGTNVTITPEDGMYSVDTGWSPTSSEKIDFFVKNENIIRKIQITTDRFYGAGTCIAGKRQITGVLNKVNDNTFVITYDKVYASSAYVSGITDAPQITVYYSDAYIPVTWKNGDAVIGTDYYVMGETPTYTGTVPEKAEDEQYTYTFSGWRDGNTTYGLSDTLPAVSGDVTYTAQFTATPKPAPTSGSFEGLTWNIDDDGTLTFSGSGAIPMNAFKQNEDIKKVIINDSVTELGSYAFKECPNLTEVEILNPSMSLSDTSHQFDYCESLTTVTLPEGMTTIPQAMFRDCTALTTVDLPSTITSIADMAFMDSGLQSISVPEGATYKYSSFMTNSLQSLTLEGSSPMTFAGGEFNYLTDEATVYIPEGSKYVYSTFTATLYAKNDMAEMFLDDAQSRLNNYIQNSFSPEKALEKVNDYYSMIGNDPFGMNVTTEGPFTVALNEGDKCAAVFGGATIGKYVPASTGYTVTWKNWNGDVLETDENVAEGATPSYDGATPVRPEDMNATYTFSAWDDGKTTYVLGVDDLPPVTGDITYTAVYTGEPKKLFVGHSVTLGGDIGVNFFIDGNVAGVANAQTATVKFGWDGGKYIKEVNLKELTPDADGIYKVTVNVVAAQMAHTIEAVAYINGNMIYTADLFSVQDYAEAVYAEPGKYLPADDADKAPALKALAAALLHYGGEAQTVFDSALYSHPDRADSNLDEAADYTGVDAAAVTAKINGEASDLDAVATDLNAKYFTNSLIYLQNNTLRVYFTPTTYPADMPNAGAYDGNLSNYYYYKDKANIAAAELDDQQTFTVGNVSFKYSPLNYVVNVLNSSNMSPEQKNLAKSLFLYNQAANAFFDEPAPAQNIVDLSTITEDTVVEDGYTITGTLKGDYKISIGAGATVTLKNADITCLTGNATFAAITPLGNATIILEGNNTVMGPLNNNYNAIFVPENTTLTIEGDGSLTASAGKESYYYWATAIGAGTNQKAGNIVINSGNITAISGNYCAAIGGSQGYNGGCGDITINGGTVTATGGSNVPAIGSGAYSASCGDITINGGTVTANGGSNAPAIGSGAFSASCGNITIADTVTQVTATKGSNASNSIGAGPYGSSCGTISIADPSKVTQN